MLSKIEFYNFENEVWYRNANGTTAKLNENSEVVGEIIEMISEYYPKAFAALEKEYSRCLPNITLYRYRIVNRFIRCNFGIIDNVYDIDAMGKSHIEDVPCPLRGECKHECVICRPEFNSHISAAEMRVLRLWYEGMKKEEIAEQLYFSVHTVNNHIRNAFNRIGINSKAEFFRYAQQNNLFS